ncbi:MAG: carboxylesterase family protein [Ilumatobacteraceae bacterium]
MASAASASYQAVTPQRLLDTRAGLGAASNSKTTPGVATPILLPAITAGAAAVALNLTVTESDEDGYATAYPCGQDPPVASNVDFLAGQIVPNSVIAKPGTDGQVCVVTSVAAHLVVDLQGWFPVGSYDPLPVPLRVLDTRNDPGVKVGMKVETLLVADQSDGAVVANVTVVDPDGPGFLTVYPCGTTPPITSNLNFTTGEVVANLTVARPGTTGVCAITTAPAHIVVDVQGHISAGSGYTPIIPVRMADTRAPIGVPVAGRVFTGQTIELSFPVMSGIPAVVDSAVMNVTATSSLGSGFLTVFPCDQPRPLASNLNIAPGETRPNLVLSQLSAQGTICIFANAPMQVVVDLQGWFPSATPPPPVSAPERQHVDRTTGLEMGYLAYLPAGYNSSPGRTWPTIVFLHGSGQVGTGTGASLDSVAVNGLPLLYESRTEPAAAAGFIVLVPQLPDNTNNPPRLRLWMDEVLSRYGVDRDRLYLTGLSQGGFGTFDYLEYFGNTNEFAAMVPIAGGFNRVIECAEWRNTPLWAFHGEQDPNVNVAGSIRTVQYVDANCAPTEPMRLTTYPGVGHDSWDLTYTLSGMAPGLTDPSYNPYDVDVYTWMLGHVRSRTR